MPINSQRVIGSFSQGKPGPLLFFLGGIHGNEPAGVYALERVFKSLGAINPSFNGEIIGVRGNVPALEVGKRYLDRDLNRLWTVEEIQRIRELAKSGELNREERELFTLVNLIEEQFAKAQGPTLLIDLHTTSAHGGLFSIVTEHDAFNHQLASALHAPVIFRLTDALSTTTNRFMEERNLKGLAFESGQHEDPRSVDLHESAIWLAMEKCGCIHADDIPNFDHHHKQLIEASRTLPHYVEVTYKHNITAGDGFRMYPGYTNFHEVYKGEPIARDSQGEIICPDTGMVLMPLYQKQGEEGFYIIQKIDEPPNR